MSDKSKTKEQLQKELASLRQRLAELETVEADSQRIIRAFWDKEEVLGKFMNACPDAVLLFDSKMNYITFNKAAQELTGVTLEQAVGKNVTDFIPDIKKSGRYAQYMNVIRTGKSFYADDLVPHSIFGDRHFAVRAFKVGDGLGLIFTDIPERKQVEEVLRESEERWHSVVQNVPSTIITVDRQGKILFINRTISGYPIDSIVGKSCYAFIYPEYHEIARGCIKRVFETGEPQSYESSGNRLDGKMNWYSSRLGAIKQDDEIVAAIMITTEITERKRIEQILQKSEEKYRSMVENINDVIYLTDNKGTITYISPVIKRVIGYNPEEVVGKPFAQFIHPDDLPDVVKNFQNTLSGNPPQPSEHRTLGKDGNMFYVRAFSWPIMEEGKPAGVTGMITDVTARKNAEEALRESENKYKLLTESSLTGIFIQQGEKFVYANDRFAQMHGYELPEFLGMDYLLTIHPSHRDMVAQRASTRLAGEPIPEPFQYQRVRKDGTAFWCEVMARTIEYQGKPAIMGNTIDITERKQAEEALANEATRRRVLIEQSRDGIVILDQDGHVYESNQKFADMLGYPLEAVRQLNVYDWEFLYPPERTIEMIRSVDEKGDHFETKHRRRDGSIYDVEISTNAALFAGQKLIFCVCRDVTQRKQMEEELKLRAQLLDNATDLIFLRDLDENFVYANETALKALGYSREEFLKLKVRQVIAPGSPWIKNSLLEELLAKGTFTYETAVIRKDGSIIPVEAHARLIEIGGKNLILSTVRDITERRQAEEALRESEERYRRLVEQSPDMIGVLVEQQLVYLNQAGARLFGAERPEQMLGKSTEDYMHPDDLPVIRERARRAAETGEPNPLIEFRIIRLDGTVLEMEGVSIPFTYQGRRTTQFICRDITERKRAEEALSKSRQEMRALSRHLQVLREEERKSIARELHDELGQALTALKLDLSWLSSRLPPKPETLLQKVESMSQFIDGSMEMVKRISSELRPGLLDDLGLQAAIEWYIGEFQQRAKIKCRATFVPEDLVLEPELATAIFRIVQEALTNISRHARATSVTISLREKAGMLELTIKDNGIGTDRIKITSPKSLGIIGMRERAAALGGKLEISGDPSKGTTVIACMPLNVGGGVRD